MYKIFIFIVLSMPFSLIAKNRCFIIEGNKKTEIYLDDKKDVISNDQEIILKYLVKKEHEESSEFNIEYKCEGDPSLRYSKGLLLFDKNVLELRVKFNKSSNKCYENSSLKNIKDGSIIFVLGNEGKSFNYILYSAESDINKEIIKLKVNNKQKFITAYKVNKGCFYKSEKLSFNGIEENFVSNGEDFEPYPTEYIKGLCQGVGCKKTQSTVNIKSFKKSYSLGVGFGYRLGLLKIDTKEDSFNFDSGNFENLQNKSTSEKTQSISNYYDIFYKHDVIFIRSEFEPYKFNAKEESYKNGMAKSSTYDLNLSKFSTKIGLDVAKINHIENTEIEVGVSLNINKAPTVFSKNEERFFHGLFFKVSDIDKRLIKSLSYSYDFDNDQEIKFGYQYILNKNIIFNFEGFFKNWSVKDNFRYKTEINQYGISTGIVLQEDFEK